jgi:hypothetical protein
MTKIFNRDVYLKGKTYAGLGLGQVFPQVNPSATVAAKTATATLTASDFGKNLTNTGASGTIVLTLPSASAVRDLCVRIQVTVAQIVSLSPISTEAVFLGGNGVVNKDLSIAGVIGNYVDVYSDGTRFLVTGYAGVATKEA